MVLFLICTIRSDFVETITILEINIFCPFWANTNFPNVTNFLQKGG
nr:MAG TPA: hypothetical protein [Caudoviricetes sp.]